jgi:hypothetical protein
MFNYIQDRKSVPLRFSSLYKISTRGEKKRGEKIRIGRTGIKEGKKRTPEEHTSFLMLAALLMEPDTSTTQHTSSGVRVVPTNNKRQGLNYTKYEL